MAPQGAFSEFGTQSSEFHTPVFIPLDPDCYDNNDYSFATGGEINFGDIKRKTLRCVGRARDEMAG